MKELSIEQKAKRYDEAKARMSRAYNSNRCTIGFMNEIFPEFEENEDERIRKGIESIIKYYKDNGETICPYPFVTIEEALAWFEKQDEQKPTDKDEPKFKVGDWVVFKNKHQSIYQVEKIEDGYYILRHTHGGTFRICVLHNESLRHWAIQDEKDGDILVVGDEDGTGIAICGKNDKLGNNILYCYYDDENGFAINTPIALACLLHPATKEQSNILFQKMKEAGYEWDAEKKELKKIEQKPAWSEEDERNLEGIIDEIEANKNNAPDYDLATYDRFLNWLKSLRPQNRWKPSDEQMKALIDALSLVKNCGEESAFDLRTLYEQLNKL